MSPGTATESWKEVFRSQGFQVEETHISWVFLKDDRAYKMKRPVTFAYLDYSTPEKRRKVCEREVELNRRLAIAAEVEAAREAVNPEEGLDASSVDSRQPLEVCLGQVCKSVSWTREAWK